MEVDCNLKKLDQRLQVVLLSGCDLEKLRKSNGLLSPPFMQRLHAKS